MDEPTSSTAKQTTKAVHTRNRKKVICHGLKKWVQPNENIIEGKSLKLKNSSMWNLLPTSFQTLFHWRILSTNCTQNKLIQHSKVYCCLHFRCGNIETEDIFQKVVTSSRRWNKGFLCYNGTSLEFLFYT